MMGIRDSWQLMGLWALSSVALASGPAGSLCDRGDLGWHFYCEQPAVEAAEPALELETEKETEPASPEAQVDAIVEQEKHLRRLLSWCAVVQPSVGRLSALA